MDDRRIADIAEALLHSLDTGVPAERIPDLDMSTAYRIAERVREMREARGERVVGRKIGFTNTTIWPLYGISGPMWNYMWASTVADLEDEPVMSVAGFSEPRIEPEIVLHLAAAPRPGMEPRELLGCIAWVAHGFEVVQSVFPGWRFTGAELAAAFGLHGALRIGPVHAVRPGSGWDVALENFAISLSKDGVPFATGHARDVLGGPLRALGFLVEELQRHPGSPPLRAGETVTTGTLTDGHPIVAGETWSTELEGIDLDGIRIETSA